MNGSLVAIDAGILLPVLAPGVAAALVLAVDVLVVGRRVVHLVIALLGLLGGAVAAFAGAAQPPGDARSTLCLPSGTCLYAAGSVASALQLAALVAAAVTVLLAWPPRTPKAAAAGPAWGAGAGGTIGGQDARAVAAPPDGTAVTMALLLSATCGAVAVAAAQDLGSWLVALELATLPTIALVALRGSASAVTGAMTLLVTSLVSFAFLAMAAAMWFAATGSGLLTTGAAVAAVQSGPGRALLVLAVVLVVAGVGFKLSLVPFHAWTPEAYAGAPLPIAAFLSATSKIAALAALLVVIKAVTPLGTPVLTAVAVVSGLSMTLGNVMALRQDDVLRLLAWSTVAQAGWVVLPLAAVSSAALSAAGVYMVAYVVATLLAFAVVVAFAGMVGRRRAMRLAAYEGLVRRHPLLGAALALALLSLAGLPPGILGLVAKVAALRPVVTEELWFLAVVAALNAVLGVAVYLRWLVVIVAPVLSAQSHFLVPRRVRRPVGLAVGVSAGLLVVASVSPQVLVGLL